MDAKQIREEAGNLYEVLWNQSVDVTRKNTPIDAIESFGRKMFNAGVEAAWEECRPFVDGYMAKGVRIEVEVQKLKFTEKENGE